MPIQDQPFTWAGSQSFTINGIAQHKDTIRVATDEHKVERMLNLHLPTLCITYADMKFQNAIGGTQENFPASRVYGPKYFDPPVEIKGEEAIEQLTYIRGAHQLVIGPEETVIVFPNWKQLVIPRLRIDPQEGATATLDIRDTTIPIRQPLAISVMQFADGRHVGGLRVEKRHPRWQPPTNPQIYDLWVRVIDGERLSPIPEAPVDVFRWDSAVYTPYSKGGFRHDVRLGPHADAAER